LQQKKKIYSQTNNLGLTKLRFTTQFFIYRTNVFIRTYTAAYKANLAVGKSLIDLTAGFGVDSHFSKKQSVSIAAKLTQNYQSITTINANCLVQLISLPSRKWN